MLKWKKHKSKWTQTNVWMQNIRTGEYHTHFIPVVWATDKTVVLSYLSVNTTTYPHTKKAWKQLGLQQ